MHSSNKHLVPYFLLILLLLVGISSCKKEVQTPPPPVMNPPQPATEIPSYTYEVVDALPHDIEAFTEGLQYIDGFFYEGTGMEGQSDIRKVDAKTGKVIKKVTIAPYYFGEGITVLNGKLYELTYTSQIGFVYDATTFAKIDSFTYTGEGWGMTTDGTSLIFSNGSDTIQYMDPATKKITRTIAVKEGGFAILHINELELIKGELYANIWRTDRIIRIDPATGNVTGSIDLFGILPPNERTMKTDVLNGIAYDAKGDRIFVTGKYWPKVFEIKIKKKGA